MKKEQKVDKRSKAYRDSLKKQHQTWKKEVIPELPAYVTNYPILHPPVNSVEVAEKTQSHLSMIHELQDHCKQLDATIFNLTERITNLETIVG